jgi:hypothetical protein
MAVEFAVMSTIHPKYTFPVAPAVFALVELFLCTDSHINFMVGTFEREEF